MTIVQTDKEIEKTIVGLSMIIEQLKTGQLHLLLARAGDKEWSDGSTQMEQYYQHLLSLLKVIQGERLEQQKEKLRRREERLKRATPAGVAPRR